MYKKIVHIGEEEKFGECICRRGVSIEENCVLKALLENGIDADAAGILASGISI